MIVKAKPCYNFQSCEFEMEIKNDTDIREFARVYRVLLDVLQDVACPQPGDKTNSNGVQLATEAQKKIMDTYHIPYTNRTTKAEAGDLIQISRETAKK